MTIKIAHCGTQIVNILNPASLHKGLIAYLTQHLCLKETLPLLEKPQLLRHPLVPEVGETAHDNRRSKLTYSYCDEPARIPL